ncbi:MAG: hypothetical protein FD163_2150 [Hyphomonadaceae bacterium]|nr:MAG: hypothetical protein FD128_1256 [Hyphomonadaceae bacterium]KAF0183430.1 MAG: hypothetical protein FD163_2150 [Hyphomonadaceae bacterium]
MTYSVKECFYTLQGEGAQSGRAAVFLRFAGCNLWSGREQDRATAICNFCDTDFVGTDGVNGGKFDMGVELAKMVNSLWPKNAPNKYVVCTGGEPMLQLDDKLLDALHICGFEIAIESNGTLAVNPKINWVCISPKMGSTLVHVSGDELKLVFPQHGLDPAQFEDFDFRHFFLQPMDNSDYQANLQKAVEYCMANPKWRLSLQTHKMIGIP